MSGRRPFIMRAIVFLLLLAFILAFCFFAKERKGDTDIPISPDTPVAYPRLVFNGRQYTYTGGKDGDIEANGDVITIKHQGSYLISGKLTEGRIRISCEGGGEVRLILDGLSASSSFGAVIEGESCDRLTLELAAGSTNLLFTSFSRDSDGVFPDAAISSLSNISICGDGALTVRSQAECGIMSSGSVELSASQVTVNARNMGIYARDAVRLICGRLTVKDVNIGIFADGSSASLGRIEIKGGEYVALCRQVALFSGREIRISGGKGSIDSPLIYQCERKENGAVIKGEISVESGGFPK